MLSRSEVNDILGEFVGHKLTTSMGEQFLEKARHRLVDAAGVLDPTDITSLQKSEVYSRKGKLLMWMVYLQIMKGARGLEKKVLQTTTEEPNLNEIGAKVRKEDAEQKPLIINGNFSVEDTLYAPLFASMKVLDERYAPLNENAGDVTPFQPPSEKDFRDVTAFIMCTLLHEKTHMPRLCQKTTLSDVLNSRITSSGAREIVVHKISLGGPEEVIYVGKEFLFFP